MAGVSYFTLLQREASRILCLKRVAKNCDKKSERKKHSFFLFQAPRAYFFSDFEDWNVVAFITVQ